MKKRMILAVSIALAAMLFASGCASPFSLFKDFSLQGESPSGNGFFDALGEITEDGSAMVDGEQTEDSENTESDEPVDVGVIEFIDENGKVLLSGAQIASVSYAYDEISGHYVQVVFTEEGSRIFTEATRNNLGRTISIYADGELVSAPVINEVITGGEAIINGAFTEKEAKELCKTIESAIIS